MTLNTRERYIAIVAGAIIGLLALDQLFYSPLTSRLNAATSARDEARLKVMQADDLMKNDLAARRKWKQMAGETLKTTAPSAEGQLLNAVRDWAQSASLTLNSIKPERSEKEKGFDKILLRATGNGSMQQITRFLYALRTSSIPVRISDLQISTRREGTDELALQVGIATIYEEPALAKDANGAREVSR